jgi:hypothetical protein
MQGRQGRKIADNAEHTVVDAGGRGELVPALDHAMAAGGDF